MFSRMIPEASLNNDSNFKLVCSRCGSTRPIVTDSVAVASVGVLIAAKIKANGSPTPASRLVPSPAMTAHKITMPTVRLTISRT